MKSCMRWAKWVIIEMKSLWSWAKEVILEMKSCISCTKEVILEIKIAWAEKKKLFLKWNLPCAEQKKIFYKWKLSWRLGSKEVVFRSETKFVDHLDYFPVIFFFFIFFCLYSENREVIMIYGLSLLISHPAGVNY